MSYSKFFYAFLRALIITTLLVAGGSALIYSLIPARFYPSVFPFLLGFFALVTLLVYHFMLKALEKRPARFVNIFMLTTVLKLLVYMSIMVIYALLNREQGQAFFFNDTATTEIYTVVEVVSLLGVNRQIGGLDK